MSDIQPFLQVFIQPSYGTEKAWIVHRLIAGFEDAEVYAARSTNGAPDSWEDVNLEPAAANAIIEDTAFTNSSKFNSTYYRLVAVLDGKEYISDMVGTFDRLTHVDFFALREMLNVDMLRLSHGDGVDMLHLSVRRTGPVRGGLADSNTLQPTGKDNCSRGITLNVSAPYGYHAPVLTKVQKMGPAVRKTEQGEGTPTITGEVVRLRMLPFPTPHAGDVLVHREMDQRFVLHGDVTTYLYKGFAPLAFEVSAELLPRTDPRYRLTLF